MEYDEASVEQSAVVRFIHCSLIRRKLVRKTEIKHVENDTQM